jgi:hypothetical protein
MTNTDGPRGFSVVGRLGGGGQPTAVEYEVDAGTATAIFPGDLAKLETDGKAAVMTAQSDDYIGVIVGIYDTNRKPVNTLAASTAGFIDVIDDPLAMLEVQFEEGGTAPTAAAVGAAADAVWTHAGAGSKAGVELSETLAGDGTAAQFRILKLVPKPNNDWGHYARVRVVALEHAFNSAPNAI